MDEPLAWQDKSQCTSFRYRQCIQNVVTSGWGSGLVFSAVVENICKVNKDALFETALFVLTPSLHLCIKLHIVIQ